MAWLSDPNEAASDCLFGQEKRRLLWRHRDYHVHLRPLRGHEDRASARSSAAEAPKELPLRSIRKMHHSLRLQYGHAQYST